MNKKQAMELATNAYIALMEKVIEEEQIQCALAIQKRKTEIEENIMKLFKEIKKSDFKNIKV